MWNGKSQTDHDNLPRHPVNRVNKVKLNIFDKIQVEMSRIVGIFLLFQKTKTKPKNKTNKLIKIKKIQQNDHKWMKSDEFLRG